MIAVIRWLPEALDDLKRLYAFIEPHSLKAARRAIDTLIEAVGTLAEFPGKGRPWDLEMSFRELSVRFGARGYVVRYRYVGGEVIIVRIWHALEDRNREGYKDDAEST